MMADCDYTCIGCDLPTCRDERPSPGEQDGICADCWDLEDPEAEVPC